MKYLYIIYNFRKVRNGGAMMIGERLLDLRKDAGLTQDELADILNTNKHSISAYERGKNEPPDSMKIAIANYFKVSVDYLVGLTDNPYPYNNKHRIIKLPADFPDESVNSLRDYIDFLIYKEKLNK